MLFKNNTLTMSSVSLPEPANTLIGEICFTEKKGRNLKIRSLLIENIACAPSAISYWNNLFDHLNWNIIWSLQQKFLLTNKVKEVSFKILHNIYPTKDFLKKKFSSNFDTKCIFCQNDTETLLHLFWSCNYTQQFWKYIGLFISNKIVKGLSPKIVIFGFFEGDLNACFIINLILYLCRFYIHKCKFSNCKPIFIVFLQELKQYLKTILFSFNKKALRTCTICTTYNLFNVFNL